MTYKEIADWINKLPPERQNDDAVVYECEMDEWLPITSVEISNDNGVLDDGHGVLIAGITGYDG